jgi:hypothetical protein
MRCTVRALMAVTRPVPRRDSASRLPLQVVEPASPDCSGGVQARAITVQRSDAVIWRGRPVRAASRSPGRRLAAMRREGGYPPHRTTFTPGGSPDADSGERRGLARSSSSWPLVATSGGRSSARSRSGIEGRWPTSTASWWTTRCFPSAACGTAATPAPSALPSTWRARRAMRMRPCPAAPSRPPFRRPSTAPVPLPRRLLRLGHELTPRVH